MENCDPSQKTGRKPPRLANVHVKLTFDELAALDKQMENIGLESRSAMGRILIRKGLGLTEPSK